LPPIATICSNRALDGGFIYYQIYIRTKRRALAIRRDPFVAPELYTLGRTFG
jgi:hypothetical protein